jgi:hypothetical protein
MKLKRKALLFIGAQHPAWSANPEDKLVKVFNDMTALAREALRAEGADDDAKADWCSKQLEKEGITSWT